MIPSSAPQPTDSLPFPDHTTLLADLLAVSLTAVNVLRPVYSQARELTDFALVYVNPAGQRMTGLSERPGTTLLTHFPAAAGVFDYYRRVYAEGEAGGYATNYQADGLDNYFRLAARRSGDLLVASFTDTGDQDRSAVELALRESQAHEHAALADAEARAEARAREANRARAEVEEQRNRLLRLFGQAPAHINLFTGPDLVLTLVHPATAQLVPGRALLGLPRRQAFAELPEEHHEAMERVYRTGTPFHAHERISRLDRFGNGELHDYYFDITYQPLFNVDGGVEGVMSFAVGVSERVQAQRKAAALQAAADEAARNQAREREALYQVFADTPALVAIMRGPEHRYDYFNGAYASHFAGRELAGHTVAEALPEAIDHGFIALLDGVYQTGQTYVGQEVPIALALGDGPPQLRYYTFTYQAYREQGEVAGVSVFSYDTTEQVLARQQREAGAQRLKLLTDALPVLISYLDRDRIYRFANRAYERWFPLTPEQIVGQHPRQVAGDVAYEHVVHHIDRAMAGETVEYDARMEYRSDLIRHVHTTLLPDIQEGHVVGCFSLVVDVTAQVEARQAVEQSAAQALALADELARTNEHLTRMNVELDQFVYIASHDLKAPITNIEGLLEALREQLAAGSPSPLVLRLLTMMSGAVKRFQLTLDQLTEIVHVQQPHAAVTGCSDLSSVLTDVSLDLAPLLEATQGTLQLEVAEAPLLPLSPKNLRSLVYNLLSNALKYRHPDRAPVVLLRAFRSASDLLVFEVQDNGTGLSEAHQARLFGLFQRLHPQVEGSGVGLFMVKKIVEGAGGHIAVRSQLGVGTTFSVTF
jgi:PAS domain S-box-containing protein